LSQSRRERSQASERTTTSYLSRLGSVSPAESCRGSKGLAVYSSPGGASRSAASRK
jgi:hypothetical protein